MKLFNKFQSSSAGDSPARNRRLLLLALLLILAGCSAAEPAFLWPWWRRGPAPIPREPWPTAAQEAELSSKPQSSKDGALRAGSELVHAQPTGEVRSNANVQQSLARASGPADAETMAEVLRELQSMGGMNAQQQERLLTILKGHESSAWPQLVRDFRASLPPPASNTVAQAAAPGAPRAMITGVAAQTPNTAPPTLAAAPSAVAPAAPNAPNQAPIAATPAVPSPAPGAPAAVSPTAPIAAVASATPASAEAGKVIQATATSPVAPPTLPAAQATPAAPIAAPAVLPAAPTNDARPGDWRFHLAAAIGALEAQASANADPQIAAAEFSRLRLLYLAAGRRDDALRSVPGSGADQEFWTQELAGLATYLEPAGNDNATGHAAAAAAHFEAAYKSLREQAGLTVRNLAFCTEVQSYGVYQPFQTNTFAAGQEVLLYAELENIKSQQRPEGFYTALDSSYELLDAQGKTVDTRQFGITQETCRNERRDFFIRYQFFLPKGLADGAYTLKLRIQDTLGQRAGEATIELPIKNK